VAVVVASEFVFFLASSLSPSSSSLSGRFLIGAFMVALKGLLFSLLDSEFDACCCCVVVVVVIIGCIATDMMNVCFWKSVDIFGHPKPLRAATSVWAHVKP
jgi:hypothetical protein